MTQEVTAVLFRMERNEGNGESCLAVFPSIPADVGYTMSCYSHIGQHAGCTYKYYRSTRPAAPEEYADLKRELESYGPPDAHYRLRVVSRLTKGLRDELLANVRRLRQAPGVQPCS